MRDTSDYKTRRWRLRIEECRFGGESVGLDGRQAMQSVIDSYERLIAMVEEPGKAKRPLLRTAADDNEAIEQVLTLVNGHDVGIWEGNRQATDSNRERRRAAIRKKKPSASGWRLGLAGRGAEGISGPAHGL